MKVEHLSLIDILPMDANGYSSPSKLWDLVLLQVQLPATFFTLLHLTSAWVYWVSVGQVFQMNQL